MRLSKTAAFYLQASIIVFFLAGSAAPTPIYALYQAAWHFSSITITIIFGIYALAVLSALLVVGSLSDYIGRRPVLIVAAILQVVTMAIFVNADGLGELLVARIVQGLSTGAAAGAVGAGMLDIDRQKGTIANAVGPMMGTATGGITSGLLVQYLPLPTKLVFIVLGIIFAVQTLLVVVMPESVTPRAGAIASLKPHVRLPQQVRESFMIAAPALVGAWALAGFYGALGPTLVRELAASTSRVFGGLSLFVLAGSGVLTVFILHSKTARTMMTYGTSALFVGVAIVLIAIANTSFATFMVGTAIAGSGFGASFQGGIRSVIAQTGALERAGVLSVLYVVAYLAMGLPAVVGGIRVVHGGGIFTTAREYGIAVMILAALALVGTLLRSVPKPALGVVATTHK